MRAIALAALAVGFGILPALGGEPGSTFARIRAQMIAESDLATGSSFAGLRRQMIAESGLAAGPAFSRIRAQMIADRGVVAGTRFARIRAQLIADSSAELNPEFPLIRAQFIAQSIDQIMQKGAKSVEVVTFADPKRRPVTVIRGPSTTPRAVPTFVAGGKVEIVRFADPSRPAVTVIRGAGTGSPLEELFAPASGADLDLVAFAVDGAESSHGADLGMWRPDNWRGPQGPMQVSEAAALDVGGGDRFDLHQNRLLGRAYLAHLFRRYGNWPDAVSAYNWGPGNVDAWIAAGRPFDGLPVEVEHYRDRVLREAGLRRSLDLMLDPRPARVLGPAR